MVKRVENRKKGVSEKPPENHTKAGKFNNNYLVVGVIGLFVLIFIGIAVIIHFQEQNETISKLKTQFTLLETAVQNFEEEIVASKKQHREKIATLNRQSNQSHSELISLKDQTATSEQQQTGRIEQLVNKMSQLETTLTGNIMALASVQNDKLNELTAQLQTWNDTTTASDKQQNAQIEQFGHQLIQVDTALKGEIATLASAQNDKFQGLTEQLLTWKKETISSVQQQNAQMEQLGNQLTQVDATLTGNLAALKTEQNDKLQGLTNQVQTWKQEIATSDAQQNAQMEQLGNQLTQVDTTLTGNLTDLTSNLAELAKEQSDKLQGLTEQVKVLNNTTATSEQQQKQNEQIKSLEQRVNLLETASKDNTVAPANKPEAESNSVKPVVSESAEENLGLETP